MNEIQTILKININYLNDLAGISKGNVAPDIVEFIEKNPEIVSLIRSIKENNLNIETIEKIIEIFKQKTKNFDNHLRFAAIPAKLCENRNEK